MKRRRDIRILCSIMMASLLCLPLTTGMAKADADPVVIIDDGTIAQGVKILTLDVSSLTSAQARGKIQSEDGQAMLNAAKLVLTLPYGNINVSLSDIKAVAHPEQAVAQAMKIGRIGGISQRQQELTAAKSGSTVINIPYTYDEAALASVLTNVANNIPRSTVAGALNFDPKNFDSPFTVVDGHIGFTPDTAGLIANVKTALSSGAIQAVKIPGTTSPDNGAQVLKSGTAANTVLIARYDSQRMAGSGGRFHNITSGCNLINGKVLQPGEVFSVNDTLGPRDGSHGGLWAPAPVNEDGRHELDYGGGLCRVSTSLFNAVVRADLEIVEWWHHSIPSDYVQIGCDATVSTGGPDLKFKNNTDWPIYIMMKFDTKTRIISAEIWGRPLNSPVPLDPGTKIKIELMGKVVGHKAMPPIQYTKDPEKIREGRGGVYSDTYKIWYKWVIGTDGKGQWVEFKRDNIDKNHLYPAWAPIVMATPVPTPTPPSPTT